MIHQTLKLLRNKNRLTQQQIAKLLNIDRSTYTYYETGKIKPDVDTLMKICCIYNITLDSLVDSRKENCEAILNAVDASLPNEECTRSIASLDRQEKRALLLFRLCEDKDEAIRILREMAKSNETDLNEGKAK